MTANTTTTTRSTARVCHQLEAEAATAAVEAACATTSLRSSSRASLIGVFVPARGPSVSVFVVLDHVEPERGARLGRRGLPDQPAPLVRAGDELQGGQRVSGVALD